MLFETSGASWVVPGGRIAKRKGRHALMTLLVLATSAGVAAQEKPAPTRWAFDAGMGVRLWDDAGRSPEDKDYLEQARVGLATGVDVSVYPWERFGLGLLHAQFFATAYDPDMLFQNGMRGPSRDDYRILYAAPAAYWAQPFAAGQGALVGSVGAGLFFYRDESRQGTFPGVLEGHTYGLHAMVSAEYRVWRWVALGFGMRVLHGSLSSIRYNAIDTEYPPLSLTRVDFTTGIRFYP